MPEGNQYDGLANTYASHGFDPNGTDGFVQRWMEQELGNVRGLKVADAGCGAGRWFSKFQGARQVIGVDASRAMLAQVPGAPQIVDGDSRLDDVIAGDRSPVLVHGTIEQVLPQLKKSMDVVFASFSLCVCPEPKQVLRAIASGVKPKGRVLVSTNVFINSADAPTASEPIREISLDASPALQTLHEGARKELRIVLHLPGGHLPITDRAHVLSDYNAEGGGLAVVKAHLVRPQGMTFVDGDDVQLNRQHFSNDGGNHVFSMRGTRAALAHLCLELIAR